MNIKDINNFFYNIEQDMGLFDQKIDDIYFWKLIRVTLNNKIVNKKGILGQAHSKNKSTLKSRLQVIPSLMINTYIYGVGSRRRKVDTLVFEHPRKLNLNGEFVDIYTNSIVKQLENTNTSFELVDHPELRKHYNKASKKRSYLEHYYIPGLLFSYFKSFKFTETEKTLIKEIEDKFSSYFDININFSKLILSMIIKFKREESFYLRMLTKRNVKNVYLVVSYGKESLISACHKLNIKCTELQHGIINKYHLGYNFTGQEHVPYFPNFIHLFGDFWTESVNIPLPKSHLLIKGYEYLNNMLSEFEKIDTIKDQILFISQGTIGRNLSLIAVNYANENKDKKIIYKLHPGEYSRWKNEYPDLINAPDNLKVVFDNKINLYQYLAQSEYVVGVYSTVIYEALAVGCKTILVDLPGVEFLEYLIEKDIVKLSNGDDLSNIIKSDDFKVVDKSYFFS